MSKAYKFKKEDGKLVITHETDDFNLFRIQRIHGTFRPKGRRTDFDAVVDYDGNVVLVKRKDLLNYDVLHSFITMDKRRLRSKQHSPWYDDMFDTHLLEDAGIEVLTCKYFYRGDEELLDVFCPVRKDKLNENIKIYERLEKQSKLAIESYNRYMNMKKNQKGITWSEV